MTRIMSKGITITFSEKILSLYNIRVEAILAMLNMIKGWGTVVTDSKYLKGTNRPDQLSAKHHAPESRLLSITPVTRPLHNVQPTLGLRRDILNEMQRLCLSDALPTADPART